MPVDVVTWEEFQALAARVKAPVARVEGLVAANRATSRAYLTPVDVAKRHGVSRSTVYGALRLGKLAAETRPRGDRVFYRIQPADARRWYDRFVRGPSNQ